MCAYVCDCVRVACASVFACVWCVCAYVLSSWHSLTNLSSIQIFTQMESGLNFPLEVWPTLVWDAACPCACVFPCVVCLCVFVLSSWHSSTNLSSIQIFHSDGKRPDSNSIVPWKCPFPFVDVHFYNKICHVLNGQSPD